jgi:transportin-3
MEAQATATATVKEALAALYHHPDDAIRTAADRWLQEFQHTLDAWQVCARFSRFALFLFVS